MTDITTSEWFSNPIIWLILITALFCYSRLIYFCWLCPPNDLWKHRVISWRKSLKSLIGVLPLLGLLGTISGLVSTFSLLAQESEADIQQLMSSGISQALITTQLGIALAIPGILLLSYLNRKVTRLARQ